MDGGAWWAAVHGVAKSQIRLSDFTFTFHFHALEKEMTTHSSVLAWRIPETGDVYGVAQSQTRLKWLSSSSRQLTRKEMFRSLILTTTFNSYRFSAEPEVLETLLQCCQEKFLLCRHSKWTSMTPLWSHRNTSSGPQWKRKNASPLTA